MGVPYKFINVGVWNIHGLFSNVNKVKLNKLHDPEFEKRLKSFEILCLQETQCGPKETEALAIKGYHIIPFHRKISDNKRYFGGTLLVVKEEIREGIKIIENFEGDKTWIKLKKDFFRFDRDIFICFVYAPPASSPYTNSLDYDIFQNLEEDISRFSNDGSIILAGDLNAKTGTERDFVSDLRDEHSPINDVDNYNFDKPLHRRNQDKHPVDNQGENFLNLCKNTRIRILNGRVRGDRLGKFTRYPLAARESPSTLDYIATDTKIFTEIQKFSVLQHLGLSDHECLSVSIKTKGFCVSPPLNPHILKEKLFKYASPEEFLMKLKSPLWQIKQQSLLKSHERGTAASTEMLSLDFVNFLSSVSEAGGSWNSKRKRHRSKKVDGKKPLWYGSECTKIKGILNRAEKKFRKHPFNTEIRTNLFAARKKFKRICREKERKFRALLTAKLLSIENEKPVEFWNLVKRMKKWGKIESDPIDNIHPNTWLQHFKNLLNNGVPAPCNMINELETLENVPFFSELDFRITTNEIEKALRRLNKKASPGADKVSGNLLFAGREVLMPLYKLFFNKLFSHATQPKILSINYLKPIFKKGDNSDPENYRGIAVGSALTKVFSLIILDRLETMTQNSHPISPNQIGFKKSHRTSDHIFVLKTIINKIVKNNKKKLYVAFIDFRKAYDKINRTLLFLKLQKLGINGLLYKNIKALYESVIYLIRVTGGTLEPIHSKFGLKQGGVLSPLLFNLYIDDIRELFDNKCDPVTLFNDPISHLLYADDLALLSTTQSGLNECLHRLERFCTTWQLEVNIKKSNIIIFNSPGHLICGPKFFFQGKPLELARSYCYLGIDLVCSGSFRTAQINLMEKARKAMFPLLSAISQFKLPCGKSLKFFHSMIRPIALYNSENLAHLTQHQIEAITQNKNTLLSYISNSYTNVTHQKFLKYILGVKQNCSNLTTLGELGEYPLLIHGLISLLSFWHRTTQMPEDTLVKQALNLLSGDEHAQSDWLSTVKFLLSFLNMESYLENPKLVTTKNFTDLCAKRIKNKFVDEWRKHTSGVFLREGQTSKLRFYKLFKTTFSRESYLDMIPNFHLRKAITKFRCSDHTLEIETGRHKKLRVEERICKLCKNSVETELHFLQICPIYNDLRRRYFGNCILPNWHDIIQCKDKKSAFNLANFLTKAFHARKRALGN